MRGPWSLLLGATLFQAPQATEVRDDVLIHPSEEFVSVEIQVDASTHSLALSGVDDAFQRALQFCDSHGLTEAAQTMITAKLVSQGAGIARHSSLDVVGLAHQLYQDGYPSLCSALLKDRDPSELAGACCFASSDLECALAIFETLLPATIDSYATTLYQMGHLDGAIEAFERSLEMMSHDPKVHLELSGLYSEIGDYASALQHADWGLQLPEHEYDSLLLLSKGKIHLRLGEAGLAIEVLTRALEGAPTNVEVITTLAHAKTPLAPPLPEQPILPQIDSLPSVSFATFASDPTRCELLRLKASASHHSISIDVLGANIPATRWRNGMKLSLLLKYASSLPEDTLVVIVDGYDVVLSGTASEFYQRYLYLAQGKAPGSIIFQADYTFYCPLNNPALSADIAIAYPTSPTIYRYLSSGGIAGPAHAIVSLVKTLLDNYANKDWSTKSDQALIIRHLVENQPSNLLVDHHQVLFSGNGGRVNQDHSIRDGRLFNHGTGTFPVSFHAPGHKRYQQEMYSLLHQGWDNHIPEC